MAANKRSERSWNAPLLISYSSQQQQQQQQHRQRQRQQQQQSLNKTNGAMEKKNVWNSIDASLSFWERRNRKWMLLYSVYFFFFFSFSFYDLGDFWWPLTFEIGVLEKSRVIGDETCVPAIWEQPKIRTVGILAQLFQFFEILCSELNQFNFIWIWIDFNWTELIHSMLLIQLNIELLGVSL